MKKLYALLVLACMTLVAQAQSLKSDMPIRAEKPSAHVLSSLQSISANSILPNDNFVTTKRASRRAVTNISQLTGDFVAISGSYDYDSETEELVAATVPATAFAVTITKTGNNTIGIKGLAGGDKVIKATVNLSEGTFSIAQDQVLYTSQSYGDVKITNSESNAAITGKIYDDGLVFDNIWHEKIVYNKQTYRFSYFYTNTVIVKSNATMSFKSGTTNKSAKVLVAVDDGKYVASIFNFADEGLIVGANLLEDNKFAIESQLVLDGGDEQGLFYTYALSDDEESVSELIEGTGTDKVLTYDGKWTLYSETGYWFGAKSTLKVTITDDVTTFVYPSSSGISAIKTEKTDGAIYSIDGRRLNEVPSQGLYIRNGKKFFVK